MLQSNIEEKDNPIDFKKYCFSRTDPSIFTLITSVLLDQSNETSIEINKSPPVPFHFLQKPILDVTAVILDSSIISIESNMTDDINRRVINV